MNALKTFWITRFWNKPLRLLVLAVVLTPLGGWIVSPYFAGRAAEVYAERTGRKHSFGLGVSFGVLWFVVLFGLPVFLLYWFDGP